MRGEETICGSEITDLDTYLFSQGTHYDIYKKLGAHLATRKGIEGVFFSVWAPHADSVSVIGDFNEWEENRHRMKQIKDKGVYQLFIPGVAVGSLYKFYIVSQQGEGLYKADPFANATEMRPGTASKVADIYNFKWSDGTWKRMRSSWEHKKKPISVYEIHPGSFLRHLGREDEGFYNYRELAHKLAEYVEEMGFTHVELMGIAEHPFDGSWGYQVTGYYAPTSRYGTPEDFMYFVNYMHKKKIGVLLDWVPAHFPRDAHGLADFDGEALFEYSDPKKGEHPEWGTKVFDYGKNEVKNFLIANALFWIEHYHLDGLRVDAVASMLYLDYGKEDGQWVANKFGGNKNLEAIEFFKHLNSVVLGRNPGALMIAEESTAWPKVTGALEEDGLGFSMKWNMGWMNDFLEYMKLDPYFRKHNHHKMTFSLDYAYSEKYILVLSHDEVVHMKGAMIEKMPGIEIQEKMANLKAGYGFMIGHPGKKLMFMGQEFGQLREWSEERELDWYLLNEPEHCQLQRYVRDLMRLYRTQKALYEHDYEANGFKWINGGDCDQSIFSFVRYNASGKKGLLFICNFTPVIRKEYRVGVPKKKEFCLLLSSDEKKYGGKGRHRKVNFQSEKKEWDGQPFSFVYPLYEYEVAIFEF